MSQPHHPGVLTRMALRAVPGSWRASIASDLVQEAARAGRRGIRADVWCAAQALRIALRFLTRRQPVHASTRAPRAVAGNLGSDLRLAWRGIRRQPGSAAAIVLTLALGIGAATATYGVFNYALFRPVPGVRDPDRLVSMYFQYKPAPDKFYRTAVPHAYVVAMRDDVAGLSGLAAYRPDTLPFAPTGDGAPEPVTVVRVTRDYFQVLGVAPVVGRLFAGDEYERPGPLLAVISERLWRRRFDADRSVVGRQVSINAHPFTVIGVAAGYRGPKQVDDEDVWVPLAAASAIGDSPGEPDDQFAIGRLRAGATVEQVQQQAAAVFAGVGPFVERRYTFGPAVSAGLSDGVGQVRHRLLTIYFTLMAGVGMLFLVACANAANLLLARNIRRAHDFAVRAAIGASRWRLVREGLVEAAVLAVLAAASGFGVAEMLTGVFRGTTLLSFLPALDDLALDRRVAIFAAGAAGLTVLAFGVGPSLLAARADVQRHLRQAARATPARGRLRASLVCVQLALSLALVACTALLAETVIRLESVNLGMKPDGIVEFSLAPAHRGYDDARTMALFDETLARLRAAPGIGSAALAWAGPLSTGSGEMIHLPGSPKDTAIRALGHPVTTDYFRTLGIPLLAGRTFTEAEVTQGARKPDQRVVVISASLAEALFHSTDAVGRQVADDFWGGSYDVVGVVGDVADQNLRTGMKPAIYAPFGQQRIGTFILRSTAPPGEVAATIRDTLHEVDPTMPAGEITTLRQRIDQLLVEERLFAKLGIVVAILATGLAAFGIYAVVGFFVDERRREFGIRAALGAPRTAAAALVLRRVTTMAALSFAAGAGVFWLSARVLASRLFGVRASDPATLAAAATGLFLVAVLAAWLPARRAARVDPVVVLRAE
jgi:putative ABC transport system permease protein